MPTLLQHLAEYRPFTAIVVGDFMLDQYVSGAAERLSPDAPVPVLQATGFEDRAGGAANVARCLHELKGHARCFGVVGRDREGESLRAALLESTCETDGLFEDPSRPTTVKRNIYGLAQHRHPQKMFRLDMESREPVDDEIADQIFKRIESSIDEADVVCLEDYDKGVCTPAFCQRIIALCRATNTPVLVDPASITDYSKYRGATAITPNRSEAENATGLDTPIEASEVHNAGLATKLLTDLDLEAVVLTLDRHGALLEIRNQEPILIPTVARAVYDVSGAGDIVLAALAGAVANDFSWPDAVRFANAAAGLEVELLGAQPVPFSHVQREVLAQSQQLVGKSRSTDALQAELAVHRDAGHSVVLTNGCFDVVHAGHAAYLREARKLGDVLVVGLNCDKQVRCLKGDGRPVFNEQERLEVLCAFEFVDYVTVFQEPTAAQLIRLVKPNVYVKGGDYDPDQIAEFELLKELEIDVQVLAHRPGLGSSEVLDRLAEAARRRAVAVTSRD